jgi:hypothetical protein
MIHGIVTNISPYNDKKNFNINQTASKYYLNFNLNRNINPKTLSLRIISSNFQIIQSDAFNMNI